MHKVRHSLPCLIGVLLLFSATAIAQNLTDSPSATASQRPCVDYRRAPSEHGGSTFGSVVGNMANGSQPPVVTPNTKVCPLTPGQKLGLWARDGSSFSTIMGATLGAAIWQGTDGHISGSVHHEGYGQGWDSYGARYGATLANTESAGFFETFLLPSIFHQDPRYFRMGPSQKGGHRFGYAISRILVGRTDSGRSTFNVSEVLGSGMSAGLSNAYYVERDRTYGRTLQSWGITLGSDAGWNLLKEFGPDIWAKLRGRKAQ